jgi:hypothetical protein
VREFWILAAGVVALVCCVVFALTRIEGKSAREVAAPCEAAGGVIALDRNRQWICVAPIIIKQKVSVIL